LQPTTDPVPTASEVLCIVALCFGLFILNSLWSVSAGFRSDAITDTSLMSLVMLEVVFGALALVVLRHRGYALTRLLPTPTWQGCAVGTVLYAVCLVVAMVVTVSFDHPMEPGVELAVRAHPSLAVVITLAMVNGLYEETFLLGYLVRGLRPHGASIALGVSLLVRVLHHLYQGPVSAVAVAAMGLIISAFYLRTRWLWPAVFAHTLADIVPFM